MNTGLMLYSRSIVPTFNRTAPGARIKELGAIMRSREYAAARKHSIRRNPRLLDDALPQHVLARDLVAQFLLG